jgi:acyl dehydratase
LETHSLGPFLQYLDDLELNVPFACGSFRLSQAGIIAFASQFDPQPFHLDEAAAAQSYFGRLCASGLHTQGAAIGLMVRAITDVAVVAGYALHEARFMQPVWPDTDYAVTAVWTAISPSPANPSRGRADIRIAVTCEGQSVASLGVTYVVQRAAPNE